MIPLLSLLLWTFGLVYLVARLRGRREGAVRSAGLGALSALFVFTGISHFIFPGPMAEMVPPPFPPLATIYATGVLEILGAIGLLVPGVSRLAAICVFALLIALLPANIYAAINHVGIGGHVDGPRYLWVRVPLQLLLLGWTWVFGIRRADSAA